MAIKVLQSPAKYVQGRDELSNLCKYASSLGESAAFAIIDQAVLAEYAEPIQKSFEGQKMTLIVQKFNGESSRNEITRLVSELKSTNADVIIGIGGGKTIDTAKGVAYYSGMPVLIFPTIASTDAPCSALVALYKDDGQFDDYLIIKRNPDFVLVDTEIITKAPVRFLIAGMGDALATYFEARSCKVSNAKTMLRGVSTNAAQAMAKLCYDILMRDGYKAMTAAKLHQVTPAVENIVEVNTYLSGVGFESGGLAAAHAIHNGFTILEEHHNIMHGELVAYGTLAHLILENADMEEFFTVQSFCRKVGLPITLKELGIADPTPEKIMAVAKEACKETDVMVNMPIDVTPEDVFSAIFVVDQLGISFDA